MVSHKIRPDKLLNDLLTRFDDFHACLNRFYPYNNTHVQSGGNTTFQIHFYSNQLVVKILKQQLNVTIISCHT